MTGLIASPRDAWADFRAELSWFALMVALLLGLLTALAMFSLFELSFVRVLLRTTSLAVALLLTNAAAAVWHPRHLAPWILPVAAVIVASPIMTAAYYIWPVCGGSYVDFADHEGRIQGWFIISMTGMAIAPTAILGRRLRDSISAARRLALHFEAERLRLNRRALDAQLSASTAPAAVGGPEAGDPAFAATVPRAASREPSPISVADLPVLSALLDTALDLDTASQLAWLEALPAEQARFKLLLREMLVERESSQFRDFLCTLPPLGSAASSRSAPRAGERVGPWSLVREIGCGGMGRVWLAERADGQFRRQVALKLPLLAWDDGLMQRMARETRISALLEHPGIARLYDAGLDGLGRPYLALEYIDGAPIDVWCNERELAVPDRLRLVIQAAEALAYAHDRCVIHRDLKPSNVLVSADGRACLLDFGVATLLLDESRATAEATQGIRMMTPRYAAPEQILGEAASRSSDVYSLGVLAFELLAGQMPYEPRRSTFACWEEAVLRQERPLASSKARGRSVARALSGDVDAILAKALRRQPADRYSSAAEFAQDIANHLAGQSIRARRSAGERLTSAAVRARLTLSAITRYGTP
jgi:hypothetical protein